MFLSAITIVLASSLLAISAEINLENPVEQASQDEILSLPDFNETLAFKHYSGYVEGSDEDAKPGEKRFLHYWFVESQSEPARDPIVLWLNGGPGCSSISSLLRSNGPLTIDTNGKVQKNPNSWNRKANIVYLDAPAGTGYSYSIGGNVNSDDDSSSKQNHNALKNFFKKFPQYKGKDLYLAGESYAAVYLSLLGLKVEQDHVMKLKGIILGNGFTDAKRLGESYILYSYYHGFIDSAGWRDISTYCCDGNTPEHKKCHFASTSIKCLEYVKLLSSYIFSPTNGLNPQNIYETNPNNYTPVNFQSQSATTSSGGEQRRKRSLGEEFTQGTSTTVPCKSSMDFIGRDLIAKGLNALMAGNNTSPDTNDNNELEQEFTGEYQDYLEDGSQSNSQAPISNLFCANRDTTFYHVNYMNREDVKRALHIPERLTKQFQYCSAQVFKSYKMTYPFLKGGMGPSVETILKSPKNIKLLMFNGDVDIISNFVGNEWFAEDLKRKVTLTHRPWLVGNKLAGFIKKYDRLTYITMKGAGHSPATEKPAECLQMFEQFLSE